MPVRLRVVPSLLVALLSVDGAATPAAAQDEPLPEVLNVAVPAGSWERIRGDVDAAFLPLRAGLDGGRRLRVNLAIATDYQILDWLRQGLVELAIVPELSAHLLLRDGVELVDLESAGFEARGLFPPACPRRLLRRGRASSEWEEQTADDAGIERFGQWLLCGILADPEAPRVEGLGEAARCEAADSAEDYRLQSSSHLSTHGFLEPVTILARWLERLLEQTGEPESPEAVRDRFWRALFAHLELLFDQMPEAGPTPSAGRPGFRLVMARAAANAIFPRAPFRPPEVEIAKEVRQLLERRPPPAPFRELATIEPYFGVRIFSFTLDESLRLLREHQTINDEEGLALILPGGGVKAAYQSKLIDELYGGGRGSGGRPRLKNFLTDVEPGDPSRPLGVRYVIGTSGGALLGFFVATLGESGPWELSEVLWRKDSGEIITSTDVFGWTDLPRYLSLVFTFLIFCLWLGIFSFSSKMPLHQPPAPKKGWRFHLGLVVLPILLLGPVAIRTINGELYQEQVPEIEGFLFLVFIWIVMFTDHCVVQRDAPRELSGPRKAPLAVVLAAGIAMLAVPLVAREGWRAEWLREDLVLWVAIAVLVPLVTIGGLVVPMRSFAKKKKLKRLRWSVHAVEGIAAGAAALLMLLGLEKVGALFFAPFLLVALLLILCLAAAHSWARSKEIDAFRTGPWLWRYRALLVLLGLLAMILCRPREHEPGVAGYLLAPSGLKIPAGSFLACFGILFTLLAVIGLVFSAKRKLHVDYVIDFLIALALSLLHALLVNLVLMAGVLANPNWVSPLELTAEFWKLLAWLALGLGLLLVSGALVKTRLAWLRRGLAFLCSHHPNGVLVTRRFLRMAALYVAALVWWNLVLAPALYGNRKAIEYLTAALDRYRSAYCLAHDCPEHGENDDSTWYRPTAHFISPANVLRAREGTRYFLISPGDEPCPPIEERTGSGALWHRYSARFSPVSPAEAGADAECKSLDGSSAGSWTFLKKVIFASGSPFPIFAAHRIERPRAPAELQNGAGGSEIETLLLVDGGYSNNVPVEAAVAVGAEPVLIINSTHPLGHDAVVKEPSVIAELFGPLARNLPRLPAYLFERSQQVDRISRQGMFVVSLAPSRDEGDWPPLFDFRPKVVERMLKVATEDLERRIGFVESWGHPRFQVSVVIEPADAG